MPQLPSVFELINDPLHSKDKTPPTPLPRISSAGTLNTSAATTSPQMGKPRNANRLSDSNIDYFSYYNPHRLSISSSIDSVSRKSSTNNAAMVPSSIYRHDSVSQANHGSRQNSISHAGQAAGEPGVPSIGMSKVLANSGGAFAHPLAPAPGYQTSARSASLPHVPVSHHPHEISYGNMPGPLGASHPPAPMMYSNGQPGMGGSKGPMFYQSIQNHGGSRQEPYTAHPVSFAGPMYNQNAPPPPGPPGPPGQPGQHIYNGAYDYQGMPYSVQQPVYYPVYSPVPYHQMEENNALVNKRRIIKRRTRTGCLTCRKRRIKCDERKPYCFNCERSKKICLGYENLSRKKKSRTDSDLASNDEES